MISTLTPSGCKSLIKSSLTDPFCHLLAFQVANSWRRPVLSHFFPAFSDRIQIRKTEGCVQFWPSYWENDMPWYAALITDISMRDTWFFKWFDSRETWTEISDLKGESNRDVQLLRAYFTNVQQNRNRKECQLSILFYFIFTLAIIIFWSNFFRNHCYRSSGLNFLLKFRFRLKIIVVQTVYSCLLP